MPSPYKNLSYRILREMENIRYNCGMFFIGVITQIFQHVQQSVIVRLIIFSFGIKGGDGILSVTAFKVIIPPLIQNVLLFLKISKNVRAETIISTANTAILPLSPV